MNHNRFRTFMIPVDSFVGFFTYRKPMRVTEIMIYPSPNYGEAGYYICPKCKITLEREFMHFRDRCGQRLDWSDYRNAKPVYPRPRIKSIPDKSS